MHISDFDYDLPPDLIAREPVRPRDASRMMVLGRRTGQWIDAAFRQLPEFLNPSDVLVLNDTRVMRARVYGTLKRAGGTQREVEVLFAGPVRENVWEVLCKPGKRIRPGDRIAFGNGTIEGTFGKTREHGLRALEIAGVEEFLARHGHIPLPPYIEREDRPEDAVEYQTVYANASGAVAAPTAGLHFSQEIFDALAARGIEIVKVTLHVGVGTFLPVRTEDPRQHVLKPERFEVTAAAAAQLNAARDAGRRMISVGTTAARTLEHVLLHHDRFVAATGKADLFILPGYEFKAIDGLLTNFHLPRSTLLMLVSAFSSTSTILDAYKHAVEEQYRFYSYGDCMLIV